MGEGLDWSHVPKTVRGSDNFDKEHMHERHGRQKRQIWSSIIL